MEHLNGIVADKSLKIKKFEPVLIRPATKTCNGLYFLSNLDETYPYPIEIVFLFQQPGEEFKIAGNKTATQVMRESLEQILVHYYPFAGCLTKAWDGKMMVRCTGEGVAFVEAVVDDGIEVLGDTTIIDPVKLRKLIHFVDGAQTILDVPLLTVQVTRFNCGGIVLGIRMNHVLIDGRSLAEFINSWAELARGMPLSISPFLDRSILCPRNPLEIDIPHPEYMKMEIKARKGITPPCQEQLECRSFYFSRDKVKQLKEMATSDPFIANPTSFQLISAVLWISRTKAFKIKDDQMTQILTAVDGRPKSKTLMPKGYFGNGIVWSCARCNTGDLIRRPFSFAVKIVQEALTEVTEDYVKSAIDYHEATRAQLENENTFCITKWSRLTFYDTNFGWGKPAQVAPASIVDNLIVTLSQGKDNENIIVSLSLPTSAMKIFQEVMQGQFGLKCLVLL